MTSTLKLSIIVSGLLLATLLAPARADTSAGAELFKNSCARCHGPDPRQLKTATDDIAELLKSGSIRRHRFSLSDQDLSTLMAYLLEARSD
jgi:cytochrome c553